MKNGIEIFESKPVFFKKHFARSCGLIVVKRSTGLDCPEVTAEPRPILAELKF